MQLDGHRYILAGMVSGGVRAPGIAWVLGRISEISSGFSDRHCGPESSCGYPCSGIKHSIPHISSSM